MDIAVAYENGQVSERFSQTRQIKFYHISNNRVIRSRVAATAASDSLEMCQFLVDNQTQILVCGNISPNTSAMVVTECGISLYPKVAGDADQAVEDLLAGKLESHHIIDNPVDKKENCEHKDEGDSCSGDCTTCNCE